MLCRPERAKKFVHSVNSLGERGFAQVGKKLCPSQNTRKHPKSQHAFYKGNKVLYVFTGDPV